jgi:hypothetical protein
MQQHRRASAIAAVCWIAAADLQAAINLNWLLVACSSCNLQKQAVRP